MRKFLLFLSILLIGSALAEDDFVLSNGKLISQIKTFDEKKKIQLLKQLSREYSKTLETLILELHSGSKQRQYAAAYLLGLYRMEQAVDDLSKFILLKDNNSGQNDVDTLWDKNPAVEALVSIGNPAVPKMLLLIQQSPDAKTREFAADVVFYVDGAAIAEFRLQKAMDAQKDADGKERLRIALEFIKAEEKRRQPLSPEKAGDKETDANRK